MFDVPAASLSPWEPERSGDSRRQRVRVRALPLDRELFELVFGDHSERTDLIICLMLKFISFEITGLAKSELGFVS